MNLHEEVEKGVLYDMRRRDIRRDDVGGFLARNGRGSMGEVHLLPALFSVTFHVWSDLDLSTLSTVPGLTSITLWDCDVRDLSPLRACPGLKYLTFNRCLFSDLSPLLDLPNLWMLDVEACPLDERSYREIPGILKETIDCDTTLFPEREWRMCRKMHARGLDVVAFKDAWDMTRILCPNLENAALGCFCLYEAELDDILSAHPVLNTHEFFELARTVSRARRARAAEERRKASPSS